ncbi:MAG TPA: COX15/CtaA family protein [Thermoanaerobaculia bacterium]|nr:COX15/CtaA family protein [Thermoanaerobaculia bacterium]
MASFDPTDSTPPVSRALHVFASVLACLVVLLIAAGALVKSKEAGLSVPDWPLSYGTLNPPGWWKLDTVRAEHGHRLFAGTIALLTVGLALWARRAERREGVRRLAWFAVAAVFAQALLGGLTVLLFLPPAVSISHAALAELFLCLVTALAVVTSARYWGGIESPGPEIAGIRRLAFATTGLIYLQILLGALVRHNGAGLAIPDFPLSFGRLIPAHFDFKIGVAYAHRVGALLVLILVTWTVILVLRGFRDLPALSRPAIAMAALVVAQISLGGAVVLTGRSVPINTLHVATGATLLATSLVLSLHAGRLARRALGARSAAPAGSSLRAAREATS